jgi:hypothetical protein
MAKEAEGLRSTLRRPDVPGSHILDRLLSRARAHDYAGYDPFDGLNSRLFQGTPLRSSSLARLAWLQLHKRLPINLRPLAGIPRRRNPKGVALFVLGLVERFRRTGERTFLEEAVALADWLLMARSSPSEWPHFAWGYHFHWEARAFSVPVGTPNAITTVYVMRALLALAEATRQGKYTDAAVSAGSFLDGLLTKHAGHSFYAYIPGEVAFVHNANLWTAAMVGRVAQITGDGGMRERALRAAMESAEMQRAEGSWAYGTRSHHHFVDSFHTGYNLEALWQLARASGSDAFDHRIAKGLAYYTRTFFLPDGAPKYYSDSPWPLDTHSAAQAIITLMRLGGADEHALAGRVRHWMIREMYIPREGRFAYQQGRWLTNRIDYLRWTQAWAFYALALFDGKREAA